MKSFTKKLSNQHWISLGKKSVTNDTSIRNARFLLNCVCNPWKSERYCNIRVKKSHSSSLTHVVPHYCKWKTWWSNAAREIRLWIFSFKSTEYTKFRWCVIFVSWMVETTILIEETFTVFLELCKNLSTFLLNTLKILFDSTRNSRRKSRLLEKIITFGNLE